MKSVILGLILFFSIPVLSQQCCDNKEERKVDENNPWSLSISSGYLSGTIDMKTLDIGNNVWGSVNLGYSVNNFNMTLWGGSNYWIDSKRPDYRFGLTTTYTILKW